jgi:hypothetical protein
MMDPVFFFIILFFCLVAQVPARADSAIDTEPAAAALPEEMNLALAELRDAGGLSPRSKRLLSALAAVAVADVTLAAYLYARRANERYGHALLPPT